MKKIIDLTYTYENGQTCGKPENHPLIELKRMAKLEDKGFNTSSALLGSHIGTHMDAPKHLMAEGIAIDEMDVSGCIGDVSVVNLSYIGRNQRVELNDVLNLEIKERMLFVFGWNKYFGTLQYTDEWPYFSMQAAEHLVQSGMKFIAMDVMSPDCRAVGTEYDFEVHKYFMKNDVVIVENLASTEKIDFNKKYEIAALPLKLKNLDGAPCRVVLIEKSEDIL